MTHYKFVLAGDTGTGKTSQFRTFPGPRERKFAQLFDPAARSTLTDDDGILEDWAPLPSELDILPRSKEKKAEKRGGLYTRWAKDFNEKVKKNFFKDIDYYMIDSLTLLDQACLREELSKEQADDRLAYRMAGETIVQAMWAMCSLPCNVLLTLHTKFVQDKETSKNEHRLTISGGAKVYLPRLVSALWFTSTVEPEGKAQAIRPDIYMGPRFLVTTRPLPRWPHVRTPHAFSHLPLHADLTIEDWNEPTRFGLGKLLKESVK